MKGSFFISIYVLSVQMVWFVVSEEKTFHISAGVNIFDDPLINQIVQPILHCPL
jgi:hypothetical protein